MRLKLLRIVDRGVSQKERLHLSVVADVNLNYFVVFDTEYDTNNTIVAVPKRTYWFAEYSVRTGDHVILYTKPGQQSSKQRIDGFKNHFFYWGLDGPLWKHTRSCAVLLEVEEWETSPLE
jgi:hypothetical protein